MRRLVYICPTFFPKPTGFAIAFTNIIKAIEKKGYFDEVHIFSTDDGLEVPDELQSICSIKKYRVRGREKVAKLPNWACKMAVPKILSGFLGDISKLSPGQNDVFMYEEFGVGFEMYLLKNSYPESKHFLRVHGTFPEFTACFSGLAHRRRYVDYALLDGETNIVSTTNFYFGYLNEYFLDRSYDKQQMVNYYLLPNLIVDEILMTDKVELSNEKITLIQLGRMDKLGVFQKGFFDTVRALRYIESSRPELAKKLRIIMIGGGDDASRVDEQLAMLKLVEVVRHERCSNDKVKAYVNESDLVLMPSRCEGMSMFATEALSLGKPIIFTAKNGLRDYLIDGYNGLSMEEFDYSELANNIIRYVTGECNLKQHGQNAEKSAVEIKRKVEACLDVMFS